jgi:glycosyltransferase involved in cell wall biosynthesis
VDNKKKIWISWEQHRRSAVLSQLLNAEFIVLTMKENSFFDKIIRYVILAGRTLYTLLKYKPDVLFVQNPSIILSCVACIFKNIFKYTLIVDRHSNFKIDTLRSRHLKYKFFHLLSRYTISKGDITIVTNEYLKFLTEKWAGDAFILEDKLPELKPTEKKQLAGRNNIVFICSFSSDEPYQEVIQAFNMLDINFQVYITGDYKKVYNCDVINKKNINFTGFLPEQEYINLLHSADIIMVLTKKPHLLTCGAYEALSLYKNMILSNTKELREYFNYGVTYTDNTANGIYNSIIDAVENCKENSLKIKTLHERIEIEWIAKFNNLESYIKEKHGGDPKNLDNVLSSKLA